MNASARLAIEERMTTHRLGSYVAAEQRIPELEGVEHQQVRSSMWCNNYRVCFVWTEHGPENVEVTDYP